MKAIQLTSVAFLLWLPADGVSAQKHETCETAYEIYTKESLKLLFKGKTQDVEKVSSEDCLIEKMPKTWLTWEIAEAGYLTFDITPDNLMEDIDFAVYQLHPEQKCADMRLIRCMESGINVNFPETSKPCTGATGLSLGERSQKLELPGCDEGDNNYLSALSCKKGERYALVIQNYDNAIGGYSIDFCGTAQLQADSAHCLEFNKNKNILPAKEKVVFDKDVTGDTFSFHLYTRKAKPIAITVYDEKGVTVIQDELPFNRDKNVYGIPVKKLPPGTYWFRMKIGGKRVYGRFAR